MKTKPHGLKGRPSNATKKQGYKSDDHINFRCKPDDKARWKIAAIEHGCDLTKWITKVLNDASRQKPIETLKTYRDLENPSTLKEKSNEGNNKENYPEGSKTSGEAIPGAEVSGGAAEPGSQNSKLRTILSKRKTKSQ